MLFIGIDTARALAGLYEESPLLAAELTDILNTYEKNRDDPSAFESGEVTKNLVFSKSAMDMVALSVWFDVYIKSKTEDPEWISGFVPGIIKGYSGDQIIKIHEKVNTINSYYLGSKRKVKAAPAGSVDPGRKKIARQSGVMKRFVDIIKGLANITSSLPVIPGALAYSAAKDGTFDSLTAYALGRQRAGSLVELIAIYTKHVNKLLGKDPDTTIIDDLNIFRDIIEAT